MIRENHSTDNKNNSGKVCWKSPSNIALIKYWGKKKIQLPMNPSLSFSLNKSYTQTSIYYQPGKADNGNISFYLEGVRNEAFEKRIADYFKILIPYLPFIDEYDFIIESSNTFPHSAGFASSASSFSSLALCILSILKNTGDEINENFYKDASFFARLGSGSACRSVYPGFSAWGKNDVISTSSDLYAIPCNDNIHNSFRDIHDAILVVESGKKAISSSKGHSLMQGHFYADQRYTQARLNMSSLIEILEKGNWDEFSKIVENEALSLHAMMMTSSESFILIKDNTLKVIEKIRKAREQKGLQLCFTLDAGPNVHLLYPASEKEKVSNFIDQELLNFLEHSSWIDDKIGKGPEIIETV